MPKTTPVTFASPTKPAGWTWEATNQEVAARYGLAIEQVVRFDQNTAPSPPGVVLELLAAGHFEVALSEYPPSDYGRLIDAAAARYEVAREELLVGAGADEILDLVAKTFIPHGGAALVPVPTYPMYAILTEQRGAQVVRVPRRPLESGFALDVEAVRAAVRGAGRRAGRGAGRGAGSAAAPEAGRDAGPGAGRDAGLGAGRDAGPGAGRDAGPPINLIWLCNPNNPTATTEPAGVIESLLAGLLEDAQADGREAPVVLLDEAYVEFGGESELPLRERYPRLVVARTMSKAYAIAGLRVGFAIARPDLIDEISTYRPPGSVSIVSVDVAAALLPEHSTMRSRVADLLLERARFAEGLASAGWSVHPSATNFLLVSFASPAAADVAAEKLLQRGLIPRTFPSGHPLDHCVRLTVRNREQDDRLIAAARDIGSPA
jgi:histidinol-phosphate/aromatic aminotransferase/cobyric acid decarboxylase-like protein